MQKTPRKILGVFIHALCAITVLVGVALLYGAVHRNAWSGGGGDGGALDVDALSGSRLQALDFIHEGAVVLSELLSIEGGLTKDGVQVCSLVHAEGDLTALCLLYTSDAADDCCRV